MRPLLYFSILLLTAFHPAHAEVVIDEFDQAQTVNNTPFGGSNSGPVALNDDVAGTRSVTVNAVPADSQFLGLGVGGTNGDVTFQSGGATSTFTIDYLFTAPLNLTNGLVNLSLDLFEAVTGSFTAEVSINGGSQTTGALGVSSGTVINFEPVGPVEVNDIRLTLAQSDPLGGVISNPSGNARVVANPEPASLCLLGLTGMVGLVYVRRRHKSVQN